MLEWRGRGLPLSAGAGCADAFICPCGRPKIHGDRTSVAYSTFMQFRGMIKGHCCTKAYPPPNGKAALCILGYFSCRSDISIRIPYSRKYWRSLNLAVWSQAAEIKILADLNLAVALRSVNVIINIYALRARPT